MRDQQLINVIERPARTTSGFTMLFIGIAMEARLTHLAYAPEIAQAMLRRQQAQAVVAARRLIVEAAVGMVDHALRELSDQEIVQLDEERKAAMVNNLMVVLTSEQSSAPVLNTGTLYG